MKTFGAAYINLLKTSIGSGVLNFPYLFKTYGLFPTVGLTIVSGFLSAAGLLLLAICSKDVGRTADLSRLSRLAIPHARFFVDLAVFVKCFGVATSYVIIARQLLPPLIDTLTQHPTFWSRPQVCLFAFLLAAGPSAFLVRLDRLKYTSLVGVASILIVIVAAGIRLAAKSVDDVVVSIITVP
jgi:amino acid permease